MEAKRVSPDALVTVANTVTALHMAMGGALIAVTMADPAPSIGKFAAHAGISMLDKADGVIARREGPTHLGKILDPLADKMHMLGMYGVLASSGQIPWQPVLAMASRDIGVSLYRSHVVAHEHVALAARRGGKVKTLMQAVDIGAHLFPPTARHPELLNLFTYATTAVSLGTGIDVIASHEISKWKR